MQSTETIASRVLVRVSNKALWRRILGSPFHTRFSLASSTSSSSSLFLNFHHFAIFLPHPKIRPLFVYASILPCLTYRLRICSPFFFDYPALSPSLFRRFSFLRGQSRTVRQSSSQSVIVWLLETDPNSQSSLSSLRRWLFIVLDLSSQPDPIARRQFSSSPP